MLSALVLSIWESLYFQDQVNDQQIVQLQHHHYLLTLIFFVSLLFSHLTTMWISSNRSLEYWPLFLHGLHAKLICLKSPQRSVAISPMVSSFPVISRTDLSRASNTIWLLIGTSFTMITQASLISRASDVLFLIEQSGISHCARLLGTLTVL